MEEPDENGADENGADENDADENDADENDADAEWTMSVLVSLWKASSLPLAKIALRRSVSTNLTNSEWMHNLLLSNHNNWILDIVSRVKVIEDFLHGDPTHDCVACRVVLYADGEHCHQLTVMLGEGRTPNNLPIPSIGVVCCLALPEMAPSDDDISPLVKYGMCMDNIASHIRDIEAMLSPMMRVILCTVDPNDKYVAPPAGTGVNSLVLLRPASPDDWSAGSLTSREPMSLAIAELLANPTSHLILALAATTRQDRICFYYPFCCLIAKECGGYTEGTCKCVNDGSVVIPDDKEEFQKIKKKASNERKAESARAKLAAKRLAASPATPVFRLPGKVENDDSNPDFLLNAKDGDKKKRATSSSAATPRSAKKPRGNAKSPSSVTGVEGTAKAAPKTPVSKDEVKRSPSGGSKKRAPVKKGSGVAGRKDGAKTADEETNMEQNSEVATTEEVPTGKKQGDDNTQESAAKHSSGPPTTPVLHLPNPTKAKSAKKKKKGAKPNITTDAASSAKKPNSNDKSRKAAPAKMPVSKEAPGGGSNESAAMKKGGVSANLEDGAETTHEAAKSVLDSETATTEEVATEIVSGGDDNAEEPTTALPASADDESNSVTSSSKRKKSDDTEAEPAETPNTKKKKKKKKQSKKKDKQVD